jgi:hypothetical protein
MLAVAMTKPTSQTIHRTLARERMWRIEMGV